MNVLIIDNSQDAHAVHIKKTLSQTRAKVNYLDVSLSRYARKSKVLSQKSKILYFLLLASFGFKTPTKILNLEF